MRNHLHIQNSAKGFTLVELMVSLAIFSIVMLISVGTLFTLIDANAKAQALHVATTNLSFALDAMTRDMRTGHDYYCFSQPTDPALSTGDVQNCISGGDSLSFIRDWDSKRVWYRLHTDTDFSRIEQKVGSRNWEVMTSDTVWITNLSFVVRNSDGLPDNDQPTIDVIIQGYVNNGLETNTDFNIQTHIVSRRLDIL